MMQARYQEMRGIVGAGIGTGLIWSVVVVGGASNMHFGVGPCVQTHCPAIMGVEIRSWWAWTLVMFATVTKEGLVAFGYTTYRAWFNNEVMDHKATVIHRPAWQVLGMVVIWKAFTYSAHVFDFMVVLAGDIQFIAAQFLAEACVYCLNAQAALKQKEPRLHPDGYMPL